MDSEALLSRAQVDASESDHRPQNTGPRIQNIIVIREIQNIIVIRCSDRIRPGLGSDNRLQVTGSGGQAGDKGKHL